MCEAESRGLYRLQYEVTCVLVALITTGRHGDQFNNWEYTSLLMYHICINLDENIYRYCMKSITGSKCHAPSNQHWIVRFSHGRCHKTPWNSWNLVNDTRKRRHKFFRRLFVSHSVQTLPNGNISCIFERNSRAKLWFYAVFELVLGKPLYLGDTLCPICILI